MSKYSSTLTKTDPYSSTLTKIHPSMLSSQVSRLVGNFHIVSCAAAMYLERNLEIPFGEFQVNAYKFGTLFVGGVNRRPITLFLLILINELCMSRICGNSTRLGWVLNPSGFHYHITFPAQFIPPPGSLGRPTIAATWNTTTLMRGSPKKRPQNP